MNTCTWRHDPSSRWSFDAARDPLLLFEHTDRTPREMPRESPAVQESCAHSLQYSIDNPLLIGIGHFMITGQVESPARQIVRARRDGASQVRENRCVTERREKYTRIDARLSHV